ncbi:Sau3AI family type II restriction endonuclease [Paenilisteria rocourtiae]|nr:Sau3AI family type II restriction endonuclease [Listeria rocourtiae]
MTYNYTEEWSREKIFEVADELVGKTLGEIDKSGWLEKKANKGKIGNMIQSDFFGIPANSISGPDFIHHGIELKVTPVLEKSMRDYTSKERLVLSMINYENDYKIPFEESVVNKKAKDMLLIFYLHKENMPVKDFRIIKTTLFELPLDDELQVRQDYEAIIGKIREGKAHEISEKQQVFLGACTKGQGKGKDFVKQPFSPELAKKRAYSYKVGYMSAYVRGLLRLQKTEHINVPKEKSFVEGIKEILDTYNERTASEINNMLSDKQSSNSKSFLFNIISAMFETKGSNVNRTEEFIKEGYCIKTIVNRLQSGKNQDMSFPNIDFTEIYNDEFEDSTWYGYFAETNYILVVWDEYKENEYRFIKYVEWTPGEEILIPAEKLYNKIKYMLDNNLVEVDNEGKSNHETWIDNLPKRGEFAPLQIRPKGSGESVIINLPNSHQRIKKKSIMIDKSYMRRIVGLD